VVVGYVRWFMADVDAVMSAREEVVVVIEVALGLVLAWVVAKARRVAVRADGVVDAALDAAVDRVGQVVMDKLGSDSALQRLQEEAKESGEISELTQQRVELTLKDAVARDTEFAERLAAAVAEAKKASGEGAVAGAGGVAISGGVNAKDSGLAIGVVAGGSVSVDRPASDPHRPGRA
jgi:hypothetical protein